MWKTFKEKEPKNNQEILIKCKDAAYPEVGVFQEFLDGDEIFIPANDDVEQIKNVLKWMPIPE